MNTFLTILITLTTIAVVFCIYKILEIDNSRKEEAVKHKRRGIVTDYDWVKQYFQHIADNPERVCIEVIEIEKIGSEFSKLAFVKVTGSLSQFQKKVIKDEMPLVIESNKLTWSST